MNPKGSCDSSKGQYKGVRGIGECGVLGSAGFGKPRKIEVRVRFTHLPLFGRDALSGVIRQVKRHPCYFYISVCSFILQLFKLCS
jgi:hypothetical protein